MRFLGNIPWWLVSAGLHAVVLMGAALVCIERMFTIDGPPIIIIACPAPKPLLPPLERGRDSIQGVPLCGGEFENPILWNANHPVVDEAAPPVQTYNPQYLPNYEKVDRLRRSPATLGVGSFITTSRPRGPLPPVFRKPCSGYPACDNAIAAALRWLARHQNQDGSWSAAGFGHQCVNGKCPGDGDPAFDVGATSLSLLAFLGAGYTQISKDVLTDPEVPGQTLRFGDTVKRGLQWLLSQQDPDGCIGERGQKYMYNHAIGTLALSEAYGMSAAPVLLEPAQKAVDFLVAAQNPGKAWRYGKASGENDTSVTGWAVMALKSAELSELRFPRSAYDGALNWLHEATEQTGSYRVGYTKAGTGKVFVPGKNEQFVHHETMSAVGILSRIFISRKRDPTLASAQLLVSDPPAWKEGQVDFYYWYYATLALFRYDGPKGVLWEKWNEPMRNAIVPHQKRSGCENGSWDPSADRWGFEGGRVYAVAINCLTLEVSYRYAQVFGTK